MTEQEPTTLTPYDTGDRLQPMPWHVQPRNLDKPDHGAQEADRYGRVDFDNDEGFTAFQVRADRNADRAGYTLHIENVSVELTVASDDSAPLVLAPSKVLQKRVKAIIDDLRTPVERESAEVYWQERQALILVPGEKHVRKQQIINVALGSPEVSARVKDWHRGILDTRID